MARPSSFTPEIAAEICGRLVEGEALSKICLDEAMPALRTVYLWLQKDAEFMQLYARAREEQADTLADEILKIADEEPSWIPDDKDNTYTLDGTAVQAQKLRIDARKWVASKLKPKKYGDKVTQEVSGPEGGPVPVRVTVEFVGSAT